MNVYFVGVHNYFYTKMLYNVITNDKITRVMCSN